MVLHLWYPSFGISAFFYIRSFLPFVLDRKFLVSPPKTEKTEIIERGLEPHSIDSFRQSMAEESISDYSFSHSPILSGQKMDRKFFVSLNISWSALCLLRDSQRPPTKHRGHQCASCFNDWSYFPPYPMFWPLFCPFWIGNYQFCKNKRNHMLVWIKAWEPNSQPENQCVVQVLQAKALQAGSGLA